jgi:hypothetical protein
MGISRALLACLVTLAVLAPAGARADLPFTAGFQSFDVALNPQQVVLGDWNRDGFIDAAASGRSGGLTVLLGRGGGTLETRQDLSPGGALMSLAAGDLNGDGAPDFAVTDSAAAHVVVLLGDGTGAFAVSGTFATGLKPLFVTMGDLDGDGHLDLAVANERSHSISILMGRGDGTFDPAVDYPIGRSLCYVGIADLNRDGHPDLTTGNESTASVSVLLGNGDGTFQSPYTLSTGAGPRGAVVGDVNSDGNPDIVTPDFDISNVGVLLGHGDGTFEPARYFPTGGSPWSVALADMNGDGVLDLVTADVSASSVSVLLGKGDGTFDPRRDFGAGGFTRFAATGDMNRDGIPDVVAVNEGSKSMTVHLGNGDGTLGALREYPVGSFPIGIASADLNGDGRNDLITANQLSTNVSILLGDAGGGFSSAPALPVAPGPTAVATADVTGDRLPDVVVAGSGSGSGPGTLSVVPGLGDGTFLPRTDIPIPSRAAQLELRDLNGDGAPDAVLLLATELAVLLGDSNGSFGAPIVTPLSGAVLSSVALGDLDGDSVPDAVVTSYNAETVYILKGNGDGTFTPAHERVLDRGPGSTLLADWNGDGKLDLAVAFSDPELDGTIRIYLGRGDLAFDAGTETEAGVTVNRMAAFDWDLDGRLDLVALTGRPNAVTLYRGHGDGTFERVADLGTGYGPLSLVVGDWNQDGSPDLAVADILGNTVSILTNRTPPTLVARAFTAGGDRTIRLFSQKPSFCLEIEPVGADFTVADVVPGTIRLHASATGTVDEIPASARKGMIVGDRDHDGVAEITACFALSDLRSLFSAVTGRSRVPASVTASLADGRRIRADLELDVIGASRPPVVQVAPNPLNPEAILTLDLPRGGRLSVRLFDARGHLVRTLAESPWVGPGLHRIRVDGRGEHGVPLASGIYFYRVDVGRETTTGRLAVLK